MTRPAKFTFDARHRQGSDVRHAGLASREALLGYRAAGLPAFIRGRRRIVSGTNAQLAHVCCMTNS